MSTLLGKCTEGLIFIVSGPAGTGKTTLIQMLVQEFSSLIPSISFTTRKPRPGEVDGVDYHFVTQTVFQEKVEAGDFLEYVELYQDYYGTSKTWIAEQQKLAKHVVLTIDTQGAIQLKNQLPAIYIFIRPPSLEVLKIRLNHRQTETQNVIQQRLKWAEQELCMAPFYDYQLVNDDLAIAYQALRSVIIAETYRTRPLH